MSEWKKVKLGEIASTIQTGPFGSQLHQSDYSDEGVPVVMPKDIVNGCISETSIARVEDDHVKRLSRHVISEGDIIYARRGDVGKCAYATKPQTGWLCGTGCLKVTINPQIAVPKFVFFQLQKQETIGWVEKHAIGATMLNLNTSILSDVPIELPPLSVQNRIVEILSRYDTLIENYQKQIKLLEEAAQRLYKEWFVELRFPGYENTKMVDGLPEGWERNTITDIFDFKYGKILPTKDFVKNGPIPVYGASKQIGNYTKANCFEPKVLVGSRGNAGFVHRTIEDETYVTNNSFIVNPLNQYDYLKLPFVFESFKVMDFVAICTGAAQPQLTLNSIASLKYTLPSKELVKQYCDISTSYFEKIAITYNQIRLLTEARDRLLPKVMGGEMNVILKNYPAV